METQGLSASAYIQAPPDVLYGIIADYHDGHQRILPRPPFVDLTVEKGGTGAGTVIKVQIRVLGRVQSYRSVVSEPEPGRVLVESNDNGYETSFIVEPRAEGQHAQVTIATEFNGRGGWLGTLERWFVTKLLKPVYITELEQLAAEAQRTT